MKFHALSVIKPYGQLINSGKKTIEVRQWQPDTLPIFDLVIIENSIKLSSTGVSYDPEGVVVAMVDIRTTREWVENDLVALARDAPIGVRGDPEIELDAKGEYIARPELRSRGQKH